MTGAEWLARNPRSLVDTAGNDITVTRLMSRGDWSALKDDPEWAAFLESDGRVYFACEQGQEFTVPTPDDEEQFLGTVSRAVQESSRMDCYRARARHVFDAVHN